MLCQIESEDLDLLMSWQELATEHDLLPSQHIRERFHQAQRSCLAFAVLPLDCVEQALDRMKSVAVKAGDDVVTQGEPADAFYVVVCKGGKRAEVATMLLKQRRIKAATIAGGIRDWPYETIPPKFAGGAQQWQALSPTAPINPVRG